MGNWGRGGGWFDCDDEFFFLPVLLLTPSYAPFVRKPRNTFTRPEAATSLTAGRAQMSNSRKNQKFFFFLPGCALMHGIPSPDGACCLDPGLNSLTTAEARVMLE